MMDFNELKDFLDFKVKQYNQPEFITNDPISIPKRFKKKEDIEIAAFLAASLSWGNRPAIIKASDQFLNLMDNEPYEFLIKAGSSDLSRFRKFVYRTFNGYDAMFFMESLKRIYIECSGLENVFNEGFDGTIKSSLIHFRSVFMGNQEVRTGKHVANVLKKSSAKRMNMFLRWMIRNDDAGVDFGLWKKISPSVLRLPLDLHTGNVSRKLGLLKRRQNDWRSVEEVTNELRRMDPEDPVKYDFALFGLGIFEKF